MSHTKEPWASGLHGINIISPDTGFVVVSTYTGNQNRRDDIRRIVACVNACAGITTEELEGRARGDTK